MLKNITSWSWKVAESWFVIVLLAASLMLNVYLFQRMHRGPKTLQTLQAGVHVPALVGASLDGAKIVVDWSNDTRPTVAYIFTPSCAWCRRNLDNIRRLSTLRSGEYRFLGISLTDHDLKRYLDEARIPFPVVVVNDPKTVQAFRMFSTPETMLISQQGEVKRVWIGAYGGRLQAGIESAFNVRLPGMASSGATTVKAE